MQTNHDLETIDISLDDLDAVVGGITAAQWNDVKSQAAQFCPNTVKQYAGVNPAKLSRGTAQKMATSCIAEMPFYYRGAAQGQFNSALNQYFPTSKK